LWDKILSENESFMYKSMRGGLSEHLLKMLVFSCLCALNTNLEIKDPLVTASKSSLRHRGKAMDSGDL